MADRHTTRRRVLRAVAGVGSAVWVAGCAGIDSTDERDTPNGSTTQPATTSPTTAPGATGTRTATASTRRPTTSGTVDTTETGASGTTSGTVDTTETGASGTTSTTTASEASRGEYTVGMYTELYFDPIGLYVEPGESVSFELVSGVHSAAAYHPDNEAAFERRVPEGAPAWDTGVFDEVGKVRTVTFETRGTHDYFCLPHKQLGMVGRIVVGEPGGPATKSSNPDGDLPDSERIAQQGSIPYEAFEAGGR